MDRGWNYIIRLYVQKFIRFELHRKNSLTKQDNLNTIFTLKKLIMHCFHSRPITSFIIDNKIIRQLFNKKKNL